MSQGNGDAAILAEGLTKSLGPVHALPGIDLMVSNVIDTVRAS